MAALDFPASPTLNQTYTANGVTFRWDGTSWLRVTSAASVIPPGMVQIAQVVCTGSQATVTFSDIPQNYASLRVLFSARDTASSEFLNSRVKINSDATAGNYTSTLWGYWYNSGAASQGTDAATTAGVSMGAIPGVLNNAAASSSGCIEILGYANAVLRKNISASSCLQYGAGKAIEQHQSACWNSTAAVTRIDIAAGGAAFVDGSVFTLYGIGGAGATIDLPTGDPSVCNGRLTLESGVAISTTDQTAKTTIYWTPYRGNRVSIYDGAGTWYTLSSAQISIALGTLTSGKNYDVFAYNNAGTLALELGAAWTDDTTRSEALTTQDGVLVKSGATTRRYLGTFRTTSTTTTEDSGGGTTTGVGGKRFLWNQYNRVTRSMALFDSTDSWSYGNTATWRVARGAAGNIVEFVQGVSEDAFDATVIAMYTNSSGPGSAQNSVGLDSTTVAGPLATGGYITTLGSNVVRRCGTPTTPGYHYLAWLERATNNGGTTWYGDGGANPFNSGITAIIQG